MNFISKKRFKSVIAVLVCAVVTATMFFGCSSEVTYENEPTVSEPSTAQSEFADDGEAPIEDIIGANFGEDDEDGFFLEDGDFGDSSEDKQTVNYKFRSDRLLQEHFEKHNEDFNYETAEEYLEGANRVINDENALHKLEAEDGDDVYYLEETNEFVIVSFDGYIRTYFKPSAGIDYYNRQ